MPEPIPAPQFSHASGAPADATTLAVAVHTGPTVATGAPADLDLGFLTSRGFTGRVGHRQPLLQPATGVTR